MSEHKLPGKVNGVARTTPVKPDPPMPSMPDEQLAQMNHRQWLIQFSQTLEVSPKNGVPMTPFRAGCITRLRMAAQYIDLLTKRLGEGGAQLKLVQDMLVAKTDELNQAKRMLNEREEDDAVGR